MHLLHKRGTAIIVVLIILSSLSCLGIFFIRIAMFSRLASENYTLRTLAQLSAYAGMDHSLANTFHQLLRGKVIRAPQDLRKNKPLHSAVGQVIDKQRLGNYGLNSNTYTTRIISEVAKLNINSYIARRQKYQHASNHTLYRILLSLATVCKFPNAQRIAQLLTNRQINDNQRFTSHEDLVAFLRHSFVNSPQLQRFITHLRVSSDVQPCFTAFAKNTYYEELRCAVDINNVSPELLYALIVNIKATVNFYAKKLHVNNDYGEDYSQEKRQQYLVNFSDREVNVHAIVDYIQKRIAFAGPFNTFTQFAQCIDDAPEHFFPHCPRHINKDKWRQIWRDTLKSNFSNDVVDNNCNPNFPINVVKKNLWFSENNHFFCGHTAEGLFFHPGPFKVHTQAYVHAHGRCVAHKTRILEVVWGTTVAHSTKQDFQSNDSQFRETLCTSSCSSSLLEKYCGIVEPQPQKTARGLFTLAANLNDIHTRISYFGGKYNDDHTVFAKKSKLSSQKLVSSLCDGINHFHHDGLVSRRAYYDETNDNHYYITHAFAPHATAQDFRTYNTFLPVKLPTTTVALRCG